MRIRNQSTTNFGYLYKVARTEIMTSCDKVVDVVFGIPDSTTIPKPTFNQIKRFFIKLSSLFKLSPTKAHYGVIRYSDSADMAVRLDQYYNLNQIQSFIKKMTQQGSGVDVNQALRSAADHVFTIFGGVRQTVPKTFVIFIPQPETVDQDLIKAMTEKLKSMGVRIMFVGLQEKIDTPFYGQLSSQPSARYLLTGFDIKELTEVATYEAVDTICKACDKVVDVVFGIPDSTTIPKPTFNQIKRFFIKLSSLFKLSPTKAHYGVIRYSDSADMAVRLDQYYNLNQIQSFIKKMTQQAF
ncbi:Collagen alpha-6(VI) chain [Exaiptasia diaphana]|nr:Collagen alpha-6(VI) chain [Exaiptasia diaphana]